MEKQGREDGGNRRQRSEHTLKDECQTPPSPKDYGVASFEHSTSNFERWLKDYGQKSNSGKRGCSSDFYSLTLGLSILVLGPLSPDDFRVKTIFLQFLGKPGGIFFGPVGSNEKPGHTMVFCIREAVCQVVF